VPPTPVIPSATWQQKIGWIVRLEDQRLLRDPAPPAPGTTLTAPPPSDLVVLLTDREPVVRARAALALGRVGLPEAVDPLARLLADADVNVRQTAAFALGLLGDGGARTPLLPALGDASPLVQGRAAEALGLIGDKSDAPAIAAMVRAHVGAGALKGLDPDDLGYPLSPPIEAARLGVYALARLGAFEPLAGAVLGADGAPLSRWWPVAYALQRVGDARAAPALLTLLDTPGRYTAAFAARGLARMPPPAAVAALRRMVEERRVDAMVSVQAVRALSAAGASEVLPALLTITRDPSANPVLRSEALAAIPALAGRAQADLLRDWLTDPSPDARAAAIRALARVEPEGFLFAMASLDADPDWRVRVAQAEALGKLTDGRGIASLRVMLADSDARVVVAVLGALVVAQAPDAEQAARAQLQASDFAVRAAAATALADLKAVAAVPALAAAYRRSKDETTYVARAAALSSAARLEPATARQLLTEALADRDWAVRVRAAELLKEQGVTGVAAQMRPAVPGKPVEDRAWQQVVAPPYAPRAYIDTTKGTIEIDLAITDAPLTTENFVRLARAGFFKGLRFHRVVPDFVVQGGDPRGDGEGGPGHTIRDELNQRPYLRGTVGMALDWRDTGGSQFFITLSPQPHLDARYTVFGQVVVGMNVVDRLTTSDVIEGVRIWDGVNAQ
jgi:HEAT repeat protein/cyclophilin family peptidyl-prolyl cis-trans isomerase